MLSWNFTHFLKHQKQPTEVLCKKGVLKNSQYLESLFNKVADLQARKHIKRDSNMCFPANITKFLRIPILKNICELLPLKQLFLKILLSSCFCIGSFIEFM